MQELMKSAHDRLNQQEIAKKMKEVKEVTRTKYTKPQSAIKNAAVDLASPDKFAQNDYNGTFVKAAADTHDAPSNIFTNSEHAQVEHYPTSREILNEELRKETLQYLQDSAVDSISSTKVGQIRHNESSPLRQNSPDIKISIAKPEAKATTSDVLSEGGTIKTKILSRESTEF